MQLRQLQQFVVLAETLNFRRAAERLHISQPPLSVAIRNLEDAFGAALFERSTRQVRLTEAGAAALVEIRKALFHIERAGQQARGTAEGVRGVLKIGTVGSATLSLIPRIVPPFHRQFPGVDLMLREYPTNRIVDEVEKGSLDIGLVRSPVIGRYQVKMIVLERDRLIAVVPHDSPFAGRKSIALHELSEQPFVSYSQRESTGLHHAVAHACHQAGFVPRIVHETMQIQATLCLVAGGLGVALVPSLYGGSKMADVSFLSLSQRPERPEIGISLVFNPENETMIARYFRDSTLRLVGEKPLAET